MVPLSERSARTNRAENRARREEKLRAVVGGGWRAGARLREVVVYRVWVCGGVDWVLCLSGRIID
ncbi:uncharacterized protein G2W53_016301 [Senna tora]|uniref:Uncharacterized protein n=1 Tax=Senna tora TaxID=362788 RepID=A0A834TP44_9FABA|nr:uncharacterized protein G2W53_016301 [Senna tora]